MLNGADIYTGLINSWQMSGKMESHSSACFLNVIDFVCFLTFEIILIIVYVPNVQHSIRGRFIYSLNIIAIDHINKICCYMH